MLSHSVIHVVTKIGGKLNQIRWKDSGIPSMLEDCVKDALELEELVVLKWPYSLKQSTDLMQRFNAILLKIPMTFFHRNRTNNPKIYMKLIKDPELPKQSWGKGTEQVYPPRLQTILQSYRSQNSIVLAWKLAYESMDRIENSEINSHTYGQLIFDKWGENVYSWEKTVSLASGVGKVGPLHGNQWS